jgi:membrane-bound metal-dependent hydrolase YbcI (DUF457 family)
MAQFSQTNTINEVFMENIFSESSMLLIYCIEVSAIFGLTMMTFLDQKVYRRDRRIHHSFVFLFFVLWILALIFKPLVVKMFTTLLLLLLLAIEAVVRRKRSKLP